MAEVDPLGSGQPEEADEWLVVSGTLRDTDLDPLKLRIDEAGSGNVTLDLLGLGHLTAGGCWTIRNLGDHLWGHGRLLTVLFPAGSVVSETLRSSGSLEQPHVIYLESPGLSDPT
jgi:hypothetical protein